MNNNSISVNQGWNMIGPFSEEVNVGSIITSPPGIIISNFYGYDGQNGYTATGSLQPGKGYWVKVSGSGVIGWESVKSIKNLRDCGKSLNDLVIKEKIKISESN